VSEFGHRVMRWGRGSEEARARIEDSELTTGYLRSWGVSREIVEEWRDFYAWWSDPRRRFSNPSAPGRYDLMCHILTLLSDEMA